MRAWFQHQWARFQNWRSGPLYEYVAMPSLQAQTDGTVKLVREAAATPRIEDYETERALGDVSMSFRDLNRGRVVLGELPSTQDLTSMSEGERQEAETEFTQSAVESAKGIKASAVGGMIGQ